jgi:hypothetical protein
MSTRKKTSQKASNKENTSFEESESPKGKRKEAPKKKGSKGESATKKKKIEKEDQEIKESGDQEIKESEDTTTTTTTETEPQQMEKDTIKEESNVIPQQMETKETTIGAEKETDSTSSMTESLNNKKELVDEDHSSELLEKGTIYFFYLPKQNAESVNGIDDVQKLCLLLSPHESSKMKRIINIENKKMPDMKVHHKYWGIVDAVSDDLNELVNKYLGEKANQTEPSHQQQGRLFASGLYAIVKHHRHTHLAYLLELPEELSEVQKAFNLEKEGSMLVCVKNPDFPKTMLGEKPSLPESLKEYFEDKKWMAIDREAKLLEIKNVELLLIGICPDVKGFGTVGEELEHIEMEEMKKLEPHNKVFEQLKLDKEHHKVDPIMTGKWE